MPERVDEAYQALSEPVNYNFDVKPILSDRCYACHGPDEEAREAGLRLDIAAQASQRLESGNRAVVAGRPSRSELVRRILHEDLEERMPPDESKLSLSDAEKATLIKWIEEGAEYEPHWSFVPPRPISMQGPGDTAAAWSPIDRLVRARLDRSPLRPSPEASKEIWLRRVSLDLTGLPPSIEEMDAFLADTSHMAHERVVDRLLASPHYGERLAVEWLDAARYADTHGYQDDGVRFVWPWRDWVVKAFNDNLPYDQFLTWQLAGDLLPGATQEQRLATTFLRNHRINSEAGIVGEEYRVEYVADRTNTVGTAVMGLTLQCARCHDHKYDPISQKEYYRLFSYFNNVRELGEIANEGNPGPLMPLITADAETKLDSMKAAIRKQENRLEKFFNSVDSVDTIDIVSTVLKQSLSANLTTHLEFDLLIDKQLTDLASAGSSVSISGNPELVEGRIGNGLKMEHYDVVRLDEATAIERYEPFSASIWVNPPADTGYVPLWGNPGNKNIDFKGYELYLQGGRPVVRLCHAVPHNYIEVEAPDVIQAGEWTHLVVTYDGSSRADGLRLYIDGRQTPLKTNWDRLYKSIKQGGLRLGGSNSRGGFAGGVIDEFRFYDREISDIEARWLFDQTIAPPNETNRRELLLLDASDYQQALAELQRLRRLDHELRDTIPEIMVMEETATPRSAFVLARGAYDARREAVSSGTPALFESLPADSGGNRLDLARWLTSPDHPLTARVAVNRFWQMLFGRGLVATPGDWGSQGELPSHPELLDWLAARFVESGWDVKSLFKEIVLSATYRQSSHIEPEHMEHDPGNTLLARGPAFRLSAEMIRDQALATSGLLVRKIGGPPVKPYQPAGLWEELAAIKNSISTYEQGHGEDLYRRSLYTFWKRSSPPPAMTTFDAPTRESCIVQRQNTNTPLQALALWNDPQLIEASRALAERVMREGGAVKDQVTLVFRRLTGRRPIAAELDRLTESLTSQIRNFRQNRSAARALISIGGYPPDKSLDIPELAAYTFIAQTIMSYDAAVMKR